MAKLRKHDEGRASLFPFMSILACLIGILTLMISVSMQVKQMEHEGRTEEEMARALANRNLKNRIEAISNEIPKLEQQLRRDKASAVEMAALEEHRISLRMKLDEIAKAMDPDETDALLQKTVENLKLEIASLRRGRPSLAKKLESLKAELAKRKDAPEPVGSVVIRPGGVGSRAAKNIFFVECNSTGIVIHGGDAASAPVPTATIETSEAYGDLLTRVKNTRDSMVLFLLRKGGNEAYRWAAGIAETKYQVNTGKLPVPNEGKIDLSLFNR